MKKIILPIVLIALLGLGLTSSALAANVFLAPENIKTAAGQSFDVTISIDPKDAAIYTAKVELRFPANLVILNSFTFSGTWMPLSQAGYDLSDNANGLMAKTAGYPGGLAKPAILGVAHFTAKANGSGALTITANSFAYNATGQDVLTGIPAQAILTVGPSQTAVGTTSVPSAPSSPAEESVPPASEEQTAITPFESAQAQANESQSSAGAADRSQFLAALFDVFSFGTQQTWLAIAVILAILVFIYTAYLMANRLRSKPKTH